MNRILLLSGLLAVVSGALGEELVNSSNWKMTDDYIGPFRHQISVASPDGVAKYEAEFMLVNNSAEFVAELKRGEQLLGQFRCSFASAGTNIWFNVYDPPNKGLDASGSYEFVFGDEEVPEAKALETAKAEYAKHDEILNDVYQDLMKRLNAEQKSDLRERQRDWIEHKEYISGFQAQAPEGKEQEKAAYWESAAYMTQSRAGFLKYVYENEEISPSVSGTYVDERGGTLTIVERSDDWVFFIDVVRGPTFHLGFLRGEAQIEDESAHFKEWREDYIFDGKIPEISLKREGQRVVIEGENTGAYHGARAYFDGEYFKVTDLLHVFPEVSF
ncbi:MAG: hypothetical protein ACI8UO_002355 [Verrucomicrobiales bacterium]